MIFEFWHDLFPNAKIIIVTRDKREVMLSLEKRGDHIQWIDRTISEYAKLICRAREKWKNVAVIDFKDLINKDVSKIREIAEFAELDFDRNSKKVMEFIEQKYYRAQACIK